MNTNDINLSVQRTISDVYENARLSNSILADRFHLSKDKWCTCKCHLFLELHSINEEACIRCLLSEHPEKTAEIMQSCNCNYQPSLCSFHRGLKIKSARK